MGISSVRATALSSLNTGLSIKASGGAKNELSGFQVNLYIPSSILNK